jgi:hypothetical protein
MSLSLYEMGVRNRLRHKALLKEAEEYRRGKTIQDDRKRKPSSSTNLLLVFPALEKRPR